MHKRAVRGNLRERAMPIHGVAGKGGGGLYMNAQGEGKVRLLGPLAVSEKDVSAVSDHSSITVKTKVVDTAKETRINVIRGCELYEVHCWRLMKAPRISSRYQCVPLRGSRRVTTDIMP